MEATLKIPCTKARLKEVRRFTTAFLKNVVCPSKEKARIVLAVDEACANAIIHGHQCNESKQVDITLRLQNNRVHVIIYDIGITNFNPDAHYKKDIRKLVKDQQKGGMGLKIMYSVMDDIKYRKKQGKNVCEMAKKINVMPAEQTATHERIPCSTN